MALVLGVAQPDVLSAAPEKKGVRQAQAATGKYQAAYSGL